MECRTKSGSNKKQSIFLNAARKGKLKTVKKLAESNEVDINFHHLTGEYTRDGFRLTLSIKNITFIEFSDSTCALTEAIQFYRKDVIEYLLAKNVKLQNYKFGYKIGSVISQTILGLLCYYFIDAEIFKTILRKTKDIKGKVIFEAQKSPKSIMFILLEGSHLPDVEVKRNMYISEAILHNYQTLLNEFKTIITKLNKANYLSLVNFSEFFKKYIENIEVTLEEKENAKLAIAYLKIIGLIDNDTSNDMHNTIELYFPLEDTFKNQNVKGVQDLPQELKSYCTNLAPRISLSDLYCELQSTLYPEENLPSISITNPMFKSSNYDKTLEEISAWQNPANLKKFIILDESEIFKKLAYSISPYGEFRAAILFAQIIIFKSNELISVINEDEIEEVPLLTEHEQIHCFYLLKKFYAIARQQKLNLNIYSEQNLSLIEMKMQNKQLCFQVEELTDKVNECVATNKALDKKLEDLTLLLTTLIHMKPEAGNDTKSSNKLKLF